MPTVYKLLKSGELKCVKIGGRKLVTESEIERFIKEHAEAAT
jgi:excisionase family DNA binding protein